MFQGMKGDHLLEEIEQFFAGRRVREICNSGGTGPGNNRCEENTNEESTLDPVYHEQNCENSI